MAESPRDELTQQGIRAPWRRSITSVGRVSFVTADSATIDSVAITVHISPRVAGGGGSPIFDREGNVACMTYQGDARGTNHCLPASTIARALGER